MTTSTTTLESSDLPYAEPQPVTYEDWKSFTCRALPVRPPTPTLKGLQKMPVAEQLKSRQARMIYHASFGPLETRALKSIQDDLLLLASNNLRSGPGARTGGIINGLGTLGKTTIMLYLGRKYELARRKQMHNLLGKDDLMPNGWMFIPVVYIALPGDTTPKSLYSSLANFYNVIIPRTADLATRKQQVVRCARYCGTSLILIDDIHYLRMKNRTAVTVNDHLKELVNLLSATPVYAGIDCEGAGLLEEGRSQSEAHFSQTRNRFKKYDVLLFDNRTKQGQQAWLELIATFESHLCLAEQRPESLQKLSDYIFERTRGSLGAVSTLIRQGANLAIKGGEEKITKKLLGGVQLDEGAEGFFRRRQMRPKS